MVDVFVDIQDFQFRALRRVRIFNKLDDALYDGICPSWIASSSRYGIIVCAAGHDKLVSLRSSDIHRLTTSKTDINVEVTDIPMKVTSLHLEKPTVLVALACNCSGRLLSVVVQTASGALMYLYDMCAFSVDFPEQRGPIYTLPLSADANAKPCALEWNPQLDSVFAVATSDGVLSSYSFNIEESSSITLLGTVKHSDMVTCLSWSPKGKQLVAGDIAGHIRQYKPELALVRKIPAPTDAASLKGAAVSLRCVGISWLATTDFLVAYSPQTGQEVDVAMLCVKKDAPPNWTHFDDINFCGDRSIFDQRIKFTQLLDWKLVLCSSLRSFDIAVLGKIGPQWKVWTLDDSGRIEMPLDTAQLESFPVGVSIDVSSVLPVKIGDEDGVESPPCPTVLVLSSGGVLLAFNALSFRADHQNINRPPEALPLKIHGPMAVEEATMQNTGFTASTATICTASMPAARSTFGLFSPSEIPSVPEQTVDQSQVNTPQSMQTTAPPAHIPLPAELSVPEQQEQLEAEAEADVDIMMAVREEFQKKLLVFDEQFFEICERNDWLRDLKNNTTKRMGENNDINLDNELLELEKVRSAVASWIDGLENQVKESLCLATEQLEIADSTDREQNRSSHVLDFNNTHRLKNLEEALAELQQKMVDVEKALTKLPARSTPSRSVLTLSIDEEQKIAATAKNICKGIASRQRALCELQQRITSLIARYNSLKNAPPLKESSVSKRLSFLNSSFGQQTYQQGSLKETAVATACQRGDLLRILTERGPAKQVETKIISFDVQSDVNDEKELSSMIENIESRLLEAVLTPLTTPVKLAMDVGTQAPGFMLNKETQTVASKTAPRVAIPKSSSFFAPSSKPQTSQLEVPQIDQSQKPSKLTAVPPSAVSFSFKNLNTAVTTAPVISSTSTAATTSVGIPSKDISGAANQDSNQVARSVVTSPFKNLVSTAELGNTTASQGNVFSSASNKSRDNSVETEQISSKGIISKSGENATASEGTVNASVLVTSTLATAPLTLATLASTEIDKTSVSNSETTEAAVRTLATDTIPTTTTGTEGAETSVTFSFKLPAAEKQPATAPTTISGLASGTSNAPAQPPPANVDVMGDEGMMEAEGSTTAPTNLFSSFGLGSATPSPNAARNVFGAGLKFGTSPSSQSQSSSLFGGVAASSKGTSVFGGGVGGSGGIFSRAQQSDATSTSSFSFSSALANPQSASNLFGTKPTGGATFGGAPTFGSKPVFGAPSPLVSAFGQRSQQPAPVNTGFSAFAKSSFGFGSLAASQKQNSIFGGSGFGAVAQQSQQSSVFGSGLNPPATNSASFSTWRK